MQSELYQLVISTTDGYSLRAYPFQNGSPQPRQPKRIKTSWPNNFDFAISPYLTGITFACPCSSAGQILLTEELVRRHIQSIQKKFLDSPYGDLANAINACLLMPGPSSEDQALFTALASTPEELEILRGRYFVLTMYLFYIELAE